MITRVLLFLIINFTGLGIGSFFTKSGVKSQWYINLDKAPWTPPGWVFGAAWTTIMICFAFYMASLWSIESNKKLLIGLFASQWVLNALWNPVFFHFQNIGLGFAVIILLTIIIGCFTAYYWPDLKFKSTLILPYLIWLCIATSLNGYILLKN